LDKFLHIQGVGGLDSIGQLYSKARIKTLTTFPYPRISFKKYDVFSLDAPGNSVRRIVPNERDPES